MAVGAENADGGATGEQSFSDVLASASEEARECDRRLVAWADQRGWTTRTTPASRQLFDADGGYAVMLYPGRDVLEVSLRPFYLNGRPDLADQFLERLIALAGPEMGERQPHVPIPVVLDRWDEFFDSFLPEYVAAVRSVAGDSR